MTSKPSLLITRRMPENVTERARRAYDCDLNPEDRIMPEDEWLSKAEGKDGLLI